MRWGVVSLLFAIFGIPVFGGVFHLSDTSFYEPFIVVHPTHYDGSTGGPLEVRLCVADSNSETTVPALREAIAIWNDFTPTTGNCTACRLVEQGPSESGEPLSMTTVILHELGHCALGIGHVNWQDPGGSITSYTNSKDTTTMDDGVDNLRGSSDDSPSPLPGSRLLHWFRKADNDPFTIDGSVVDSTTYTRRIIDLPAGHTWPANGNVGVGLLLGHLDTQSVMYSKSDSGQRYSGLAADEVNTVRFGMSGMDETAGTRDDYSVSLVISDCASADVEIKLVDLGAEDPTLGVCLVDLDPLPTAGLMVHHVLKPFDTNPRAEIEVNSNKFWDVLFANGFESGDISGWSASE